MAKKIDTQAVGLDIGLSFSKWLTGAENLHYGYWQGLDVNAGNLGAAQAAYSEKLFSLLPSGPLRILDIGGGAGETARKLIALGHQVEIVVPSAFLATRCRENAPQAAVYDCTFEDFTGEGPFDVCLFSESYQYVALQVGLPKALSLLADDGCVIIADVFRRPEYYAQQDSAIVGGGHSIEGFRAMLAGTGTRVVFEEDITEHTAPSVDVEQGMFNVMGFAVTRAEEAVAGARPLLHRVLRRVWRMLVSERRRERLDRRLNKTERTREAFAAYSRYLMLKITRS